MKMKSGLRLGLSLIGICLLSYCSNGNLVIAVPDNGSHPNAASADGPQVWFTPDGASSDMLSLFSNPEQWSESRSKVDVFVFYRPQLAPTSAPSTYYGPNSWTAVQASGAIAKLTEWGIKIGVELGFNCATITDPAKVTATAIQAAELAANNVSQNGGTLAYIRMDEPYNEVNGPNVDGGCTYGIDQIISNVTTYITRLTSEFPGLQIGDIEPYPTFTAQQLEGWLKRMISAGVKPAFFLMDINYTRVSNTPGAPAQMAKDIPALQAFCNRNSIPFGVDFGPGATPISSSMDYYNATMKNIATIKSILGTRPQFSDFQSWAVNVSDGLKDVPINLPETANYTHTHLILKGLELFPQ